MKIASITSVLHVSDIDRSLTFYKNVLGFEEDFRFGDYVGLKAGDVSLHLSQPDQHIRPVGGGTVYVFCDDIDSYYKDRIDGAGIRIVQPPANQDYGMRDFIVHDPDGNQISFGQNMSE
jgi:catechol 2,3-dioxygenase-like lactoylglutathione lyase family enzyme